MNKHGEPSRGELASIKYAAGYRAGFRAGVEAMREAAVKMCEKGYDSYAECQDDLGPAIRALPLPEAK